MGWEWGWVHETFEAPGESDGWRRRPYSTNAGTLRLWSYLPTQELDQP